MPMTPRLVRRCRYGYRSDDDIHCSSTVRPQRRRPRRRRVMRVVSRLVRLSRQRLAEVADQLFAGGR
jgi:hypothetical protein